jgi:hypothetical protein
MKMNTFTLLEQEKQFEQDLSYAEFLKVNNPPLTNEEIDDMEQVYCKATVLKHHQQFQPLNNLYYQPLKGA